MAATAHHVIAMLALTSWLAAAGKARSESHASYLLLNACFLSFPPQSLWLEIFRPCYLVKYEYLCYLGK